MLNRRQRWVILIGVLLIGLNLLFFRTFHTPKYYFITSDMAQRYHCDLEMEMRIVVLLLVLMTAVVVLGVGRGSGWRCIIPLAGIALVVAGVLTGERSYVGDRLVLIMGALLLFDERVRARLARARRVWHAVLVCVIFLCALVLGNYSADNYFSPWWDNTCYDFNAVQFNIFWVLPTTFLLFALLKHSLTPRQQQIFSWLLYAHLLAPWVVGLLSIFIDEPNDGGIALLAMYLLPTNFATVSTLAVLLLRVKREERAANTLPETAPV